MSYFEFGNPVLTVMINIMIFILISYPIIGAFSWFVQVLCYRFLFKDKQKGFKRIAPEREPFITIMVPAHNEEIVIEATLRYLLEKIAYHEYEVLVMDDGSTDRTPEILERLMAEYPRLRVIRIDANKGKAHAFNIGVGFAKGDYILSNDADTIPETDALWKYMNYFMYDSDTNIAAVTANMDVQNRSRIIEKSQTVEFSSIVGVIKRGQLGTLNTMYAYSGANTMYRKTALLDAGLFRQDRATEDISIAWDQQLRGWTPVFAPDIMFFMAVPSTLRMLYRQRKRWAKGGTEVWLTNIPKILLHPIKHLEQFVMFVDQTFSIIWSLFYWVSLVLYLILMARFLLDGNYERIFHMLAMSFIFVNYEMFAGLLQLGAALIIDEGGHKMKYLLFAPFYLLLFWMINALTIATTFIPAIKTILGYGTGTWKSPERKAMEDH
ncbi:glycosyltransferase family 2 protein [Enterococcus sp. AD013-P3]|uniref:glycosyltransferase family 2 protein n=1 Tax=Enterococcus sp. AD013-P3 TaxID=3411036 RepID=UPI003B93779F